MEEQAVPVVARALGTTTLISTTTEGERKTMTEKRDQLMVMHWKSLIFDYYVLRLFFTQNNGAVGLDYCPHGLDGFTWEEVQDCEVQNIYFS